MSEHKSDDPARNGARNVADKVDNAVLTRVDEAIGQVIINRAQRHNALTLAMWADLPGAIETLDANPEVRVIVLRGAGERAFVSGADIGEFETLRRGAQKARAYEAVNVAAFSAIRQCRKPTLAAIRGFCMGGGVGLAAACDLRIAAADAIFAIPAAKLGLAYPAQALADLIHLIGPAATKDLIFTARRLTAQEALTMGFLTETVSVEAFERLISERAATIAENAPLSIAAAKTAITAHLGAVDRDATGIEVLRDAAEHASQAAFDSKDYDEGVRAFLERRKPLFQGR